MTYTQKFLKDTMRHVGHAIIVFGHAMVNTDPEQRSHLITEGQGLLKSAIDTLDQRQAMLSGELVGGDPDVTVCRE